MELQECMFSLSRIIIEYIKLVVESGAGYTDYVKPQPSLPLVRKKLFTWFTKNRRDLPWRQTTDPYLISVSEVMLQQTQVDRVIPKFLAWRRAWPGTSSLAGASLHDVLKLWSGLGYNSRAMRLRQAARLVMAKYNGVWPTSIEELESLPGFGPYTARAVASFADNANVAAVDTNIRRILSRVFFGVGHVSAKKVAKIANDILPIGKSSTWHGALMDFGSAVCTSRRPKCETCPLKNICRAYPAILNQQPTKKKTSIRFEHTDRYWRGVIMRQLLKGSPQAAKKVFSALRKLGDVDNKRVVRLLTALTAEGLVAQHGHQFSISE